MHTLSRLLVVASLSLLVMGGMMGCGYGADAGLFTSPDAPPSTARYRTELETLPNAVMVRESTMPRWEAGRIAFQRGSERLLVLTHITSYADVEPKKEGLPADVKDQIIERLWITIPFGTKVGQNLVVEDLEWDKLVAYDSGDVGDGLFILPFRATGKITILEERADSVVMYLNILVQPKRLGNWGVSGTFEVPQTNTGIHATPVAPSPMQVYSDRGEVPLPEPETAVAFGRQDRVEREALTMADVRALRAARAAEKSGDASPTAPKEVTEAVVDAAAADPTTNQAGAPAGDAVPADLAKQVVGKWINQTPQWYERLQLESDGTFIYASCRAGGYEPGLSVGTYELKGQYLILTTKKFSWSNLREPNSDGDLPKPLVTLVQVKFEKPGQMTLTGRISVRERPSKEPSMTFGPGDYSDMAITDAPSFK